MHDAPMACPNPIHDHETSPQAGMNIMPQGTRQWYCLDCNKLFVRNDGISTLIS